MRKAILFFTVVLCAAVAQSSPAYIQNGLVGIDNNVLKWSRGSSGSTWQEWTFDDNDNPAAPESSFNLYGVPTAIMTGTNGSVNFDWYASTLGGTGVWAGDMLKIVLDIPNQPQQNPFKIIWFEAVYRATAIVQDPVLTVSSGFQWQRFYYDNGGTANQWRTMVAGFKIWPNPTQEHVSISLWGTGGFFTAMSVDTLCVPEPVTLLLLGLGGLVLRKK